MLKGCLSRADLQLTIVDCVRNRVPAECGAPWAHMPDGSPSQVQAGRSSGVIRAGRHLIYVAVTLTMPAL